MKKAIEIIKRLLKEEKITIDECFDLLELIIDNQQDYIPITTLPQSPSPSTTPWGPWIPTIGDPVSTTTTQPLLTFNQPLLNSWYPYGNPHPPQYASITSNATNTVK